MNNGDLTDDALYVEANVHLAVLASSQGCGQAIQRGCKEPMIIDHVYQFTITNHPF